MNSYHAYLHRQALTIADTYRKTEAELLEILQKIDKQRVYRQLQYSSLFVYATEALKLSEAVAYNFIQVARKARQIPQLKEAIQQGELTVSKARKIVPVLTSKNQEEMITMAKTQPKRIIEKEVAKLNPKLVVPERVRFVAEKRLALQLGVSEELMEKLKRVQDLLSAKNRRAVTLEETVDGMAHDFLFRHDPLEKAKRAQKHVILTRGNHDTNSRESVPGQVTEKERPKEQTPLASEELGVSASEKAPKNTSPALKKLGEYSSSRSIHVSAAARHTVMLKHQGQCSFVDNKGRRCEERRWLEMHHKLPKALGGNHEVDNLTLFCAGHHKASHS